MGGCLWLESFTSNHPRVDITGIPVVCHCITNYPQTQKVKALTLFYSSFCGSGTHRACFHLGFLMGCVIYRVHPYEVMYWLQPYKGFTTGVDGQNNSLVDRFYWQLAESSAGAANWSTYLWSLYVFLTSSEYGYFKVVEFLSWWLRDIKAHVPELKADVASSLTIQP